MIKIDLSTISSVYLFDVLNLPVYKKWTKKRAGIRLNEFFLFQAPLIFCLVYLKNKVLMKK